jgi:TolB protein
MSSRVTRFRRPPSSVRRLCGLASLIMLAAVRFPAQGRAQEPEERFPGVNLGLTYETRTLPALAIQPFTGMGTSASAASQVENIIARDLRYSDRFTVIDSLPAAITRDEVDYDLWDQVGATWLVTGRIDGTGSNASLLLELHDVVYREVTSRGRFPIPDASSADFRMAAHTASDAVVKWAFDEPGVAATRVVFSRRMEDGSQDLWVIDSDGENLRRLTSARGGELGVPISLSPDWSPDGTRVVYTSYKDQGLPRIYELNLATGAEKMVPASRPGDYISPTYGHDGRFVYFAINGGNGSGIFRYNISDGCCFEALTEGRSEDISPSFSPDGTMMAFNSNRLGVGSPQIYIMDMGGSGRPELISPYEYNNPGYYTSPDWSPLGNQIAYHGRVRQRGAHQILIAELDGRNRVMRTSQVTFSGVNEDPSWAPDGRHLVYVGERSYGYGLFVMDTVTGHTRTLVSGIRPNPPSWSPSFAR